MIRSMTGFGAADGNVGSSRVSVEIRSVNHRFFSPSIKLPGPLARFEGEVREALRKRIARGHVTLYARIERDGSAPAVVDQERFGAYVDLLRSLRDRFGLTGEVDIATVLRMPDVLVSPEDEVPAEAGAELVGIVEQAAAALTWMREEEGGRLVAYLAERLRSVEEALARIAEQAPVRLTEQHARLRASVLELASGVAVDEQRLAQEIAILADRLDVGEELARFHAHIAAFRDALAGSGEPVGKRLGFLLQEMLREANTTGSKANDAGMLSDVVVIKEELERIREQVENLE